jgi:hypothetical protein
MSRMMTLALAIVLLSNCASGPVAAEEFMPWDVVVAATDCAVGYTELKAGQKLTVRIDQNASEVSLAIVRIQDKGKREVVARAVPTGTSRFVQFQTKEDAEFAIAVINLGATPLRLVTRITRE